MSTKTKIKKQSEAPYCGTKKTPSGQKKGTMKECAKSGQVRKYGLIKIDKATMEGAKKEDSIRQIARKINTLGIQKLAKLGLLKELKMKDKKPEMRKKLIEELKEIDKKMKDLGGWKPEYRNYLF